MSLSHAFANVTRFLPKAEYPNFMSTMRFSEDVTVPYTTTTYSTTRLVGVDDWGYHYKTTNYDPPLVEHKSYDATKYSWYEAQKISTANGPRYEIHRCSKQVPGWKCDADREDERIPDAGGKTLLTKAEALDKLHALEEAFARAKTIWADGNHTRKYFGRYFPKAAAPASAPKAQAG